MRGGDDGQGAMCSYMSLEERVPQDHPLRAMRRLVDRALKALSRRFSAMYSEVGRPSIAPERLLRALLLQVFCTIRSERLLIEQLEYNLLFRWFVGLGIDDQVWGASSFSKNRERFLASDVAGEFFAAVLEEARGSGLLSDDISAWTARSLKRGPRSRAFGKNTAREKAESVTQKHPRRTATFDDDKQELGGEPCESLQHCS
jgi:transposase